MKGVIISPLIKGLVASCGSWTCRNSATTGIRNTKLCTKHKRYTITQNSRFHILKRVCLSVCLTATVCQKKYHLEILTVILRCAVQNITKFASSMRRSVLQRLSWSVTPAKLPYSAFHMHGVNVAITCGCIVPSRAMIMYMSGQLNGQLRTPQLQTAVFNISCLKFSQICASNKASKPRT